MFFFGKTKILLFLFFGKNFQKFFLYVSLYYIILYFCKKKIKDNQFNYDITICDIIKKKYT